MTTDSNNNTTILLSEEGRSEWASPLVSLDEALLKIRRSLVGKWCCEDLAVGNKWELDEGLCLILMSKPLALWSTADEASRHSVRLAAVGASSATSLPASLLQVETLSASESSSARTRARCVALCDFLCRQFQSAVASSPTARYLGLRFRHDVGPYCLETNCARVFPTTGTACVFFDLVATGESQLLRGQGGDGSAEGKAVVETITMLTKQALLSRDHPGGGLDAEAARAHVECIEDQRHLRDLVASSEGIAFVADGSVLPREGGATDAPMEVARGAVPFVSPPSLRREFELPHRGRVSGMLVPRGVTLIIGGGYHGKSTLLRALAVGVYDKVPGDGREFVVTDPGAVTVRAEDGRPVSNLDVSPFISSLPSTAASAPATTSADVAMREETAAVPGDEEREKSESSAEARMERGRGREVSATEWFSTGAASGSTSQAANVVEAVEAGATAMLLDEDTCAGNFMIRDSRMRAIVHHEPITPFIYRVGSLWLDLGISSVVVVGGCGDFFDVHDTALLVDNYLVSDATERAHSVSRRFCVGRVQFAGRGLVHRLPWPEDALDRTVIPESVLPRLRAPSTTKRKIQDGDDHPTNGISQWNSGSRLKDRVPRKESHREGDGGVHGTGTVINGGGGGGDKVEEDAAAARGTRHSRGYRRSDRVEDFAQGNCECPCFCGRSVSGSNCSAFIGREGGTGVRGAAVGGAAADLSRVEQLVGRAAQARGCAYGVEWVARATEESPGLSVPRALDALDCAMREGEGAGLEALLCHRATSEEEITRRAVQIDDSGRGGLVAIDACCGPWVARPRRFEVAAALHRLPGVRFRRAPEVASVDTARSCLGLDHSGKIDAS